MNRMALWLIIVFAALLAQGCSVSVFVEEDSISISRSYSVAYGECEEYHTWSLVGEEESSSLYCEER